MFLYEAYVQIGVSISSLLYYCGPVIVMVLSPVLFKEKLTVVKITGFIAVLAGVFLVNGNAFGGGGNMFGIVCGIMSAVMYSFMVIFNKKAKNILGLVNTGIGCYFYFSSIGDLPVQTVAICGYLEPLSAVVFSLIFLKEAMLPIQIVGAVLILGGAMFGECFKIRK